MQLVSIFFKDAHFLILSKDVFPVVIFDGIANRNKRRTGQFSNTRKEWNSIQPIGSTVTLNFSTNSLLCSESRFLQMCLATSGNTHFESISKVSTLKEHQKIQFDVKSIVVNGEKYFLNDTAQFREDPMEIYI